MFSSKGRCTLLPCCFVAAVLFAVPSHAQFSSKPGFGTILTRKEVNLQRKLPPIVSIAGKSVGVSVAGGGDLQKELQSALENLLTRGDTNVQVGGTHPDFVIECSVTHYDAPRLESKTDKNVTTQTLSGSLETSFRIGEPNSGRILKSGVASMQINQQPTSGSGGVIHIPFQPKSQVPSGTRLSSTMDVQTALINDIARQIASYVVVTDENVEVLLATGGALNPPDKLASTRLWTRDLEDLETLTPFSDPREDAYRLYNIGVANEALAYQAQDSKAAVKFLQEASTEYGKALAARADEKYFLEPQNRIKTALAHYDSGPMSTAAAASTARLVPAVAGTRAEPAAEDRGLTNDDVIAMVSAHMDQANILDNIQTAPKVGFDLSVNGQVRLLHGGVNNQILAAMKQKARASNGTAGR